MENSIVSLSESVDIFCQPEESHSPGGKNVRVVTANLCQKVQNAKSWKYFLQTDTAGSAQPGEKINCRNFCMKKMLAEDSHCSKHPESLRMLVQSLPDIWIFSQEQLTQESMEGVEAAEGETS